jgi:hypothetical protein
MSALLESYFGNLQNSRYSVTSPQDDFYNCIAWAARETHRRWWPIGAYWPISLREETVACFILAFETLDYRVCLDGRLERGFEKVAIYSDSSNTPTHMARQLHSGVWTSKCGNLEDLEHENLDAVGGDPGYGSVVVFMKRPLFGADEVSGCLARIWPFKRR